MALPKKVPSWVGSFLPKKEAPAPAAPSEKPTLPAKHFAPASGDKTSSPTSSLPARPAKPPPAPKASYAELRSQADKADADYAKKAGKAHRLTKIAGDVDPSNPHQPLKYSLGHSLHKKAAAAGEVAAKAHNAARDAALEAGDHDSASHHEGKVWDLSNAIEGHGNQAKVHNSQYVKWVNSPKSLDVKRKSLALQGAATDARTNKKHREALKAQGHEDNVIYDPSKVHDPVHVPDEFRSSSPPSTKPSTPKSGLLHKLKTMFTGESIELSIAVREVRSLLESATPLNQKADVDTVHTKNYKKEYEKRFGAKISEDGYSAIRTAGAGSYSSMSAPKPTHQELAKQILDKHPERAQELLAKIRARKAATAASPAETPKFRVKIEAVLRRLGEDVSIKKSLGYAPLKHKAMAATKAASASDQQLFDVTNAAHGSAAHKTALQSNAEAHERAAKAHYAAGAVNPKLGKGTHQNVADHHTREKNNAIHQLVKLQRAEKAKPKKLSPEQQAAADAYKKATGK